ncbi:hypothetical protein N7499_011334 [Penicillium canescens]|nr:hypothetical protein N7499_011334 [Penicillium canescens]KAJ6182500.1 hypothetical protein N7485_001142 [Penicillium canescens]
MDSATIDSVESEFPKSCGVIVPGPGTELHRVMARWSDVGLSRPALIVTPTTREDVIAAIQYATTHGLQVVPGGGGHGVAVPIHSRTLYLNMRMFNHVAVDTTNSLVTFGGGVTNEEVLDACVKEGYYTVIANSGAVGMVGMVLGGGFSLFSGMHGLPIDHVESVEVIIASGKVLNLDSSSKGEDGALFNTICGGGNGLGVVTNMTMRAFPITPLKLEEGNKIWTRRLVFPGPAIEDVVKLFLSLTPTPQMQPLLMLVRAPPTAPTPEMPLILLTLTYCGSAHDAELFSREAKLHELRSAISDQTCLTPLGDFFEGTKALNAHGDFKEQHSARTMNLSPTSLVKAFYRWQQFGEEVQDARAHTIALFTMYSPEVTIKNGTCDTNKRKPFLGRNRPFFSQTIKWYSKEETKALADKYSTDMMCIIREDDASSGLRPITLPNNMQIGSDLGEGYSSEMISVMKNLRAVWDERSLFCGLGDKVEKLPTEFAP